MPVAPGSPAPARRTAAVPGVCTIFGERCDPSTGAPQARGEDIFLACSMLGMQQRSRSHCGNRVWTCLPRMMAGLDCSLSGAHAACNSAPARPGAVQRMANENVLLPFEASTRGGVWCCAYAAVPFL